MNKSEFKKAVADNEAPTPGYLYRDMANWTYTDYATQLQLIKALFDKLQMKNSAFVLHKALHLIKVLCETGHEGFQKELQLSKYTSVMKDFTTYRGPLDIKYGDSWNEKVRCEAQAALEAIFQTRNPATQAGPSVGGGGGIGATGDWGGTGSSTVDQAAVRGPWGGGEELVMPSFAVANPYGGGGATFHPSSSSPSPQQQIAGGLPSGATASFDAPALHVAEMPLENRWAAHQREMAAMGSSSSSHHTATADKPSKTILQHIASTAKSGVGLITQFEILKGKQERLYGDQFGQAARATTGPDASGGLLGRGRGVDEVGSYQPVGFSALSQAAPAAGPVRPLPLEVVPTPSSVSSSPRPAQTQEPSAFAFTAASPSSPPASSPAASSSSDAAEELLHVFARAKAAPSRVELSRLLHVIEECATAASEHTDSVLSRYGMQLASALSVHLARERPWQERLNALASLEAVLRGSEEPIRKGVAVFYTQQPHLVQGNYSVVQASLKEKAARVAQLLSIPAVPTASIPSPSPPAPSPAAARNGSVASAGVEAPEAGPSRGHFEDLLGGSASASPPATSAPSPSTLWSTEGTFEGMQIRTAASSSHRRGDAAGAAAQPPPPRVAEVKGVSLGGDGAGRPQRRTHAAAVGVENLLAGAAPPPNEEGQKGRGSIQVLRTTISTAPAAATAPQRQRHTESGGGQLDQLLGLSSPATDPAPAAVAPTASATLDDLFGDASPKSAPPRPGSTHHSFTTDDLFATPASSSAPPQVPQTAEGSQLARIQTLMQYLETRYDPAAMSELETLIVSRQQHLQQMATQQHFAAGAALPDGVAAGGGQPHRQFQTGGARGGELSERQQAKNAFADVQAEMKRKMDL